MTVTRELWARSLLRWMGLPETQRNLVALVAWQAAEGGGPNAPKQAKWNPLNTTQVWPNSSIYNSAQVRNYATETDGLAATAKTFAGKGLGYELILKRLGKSARPRRTLDAVEQSAWGTGGLAKRIVGDVKRHWDSYAQVPIGQ